MCRIHFKLQNPLWPPIALLTHPFPIFRCRPSKDSWVTTHYSPHLSLISLQLQGGDGVGDVNTPKLFTNMRRKKPNYLLELVGGMRQLRKFERKQFYWTHQPSKWPLCNWMALTPPSEARQTTVKSPVQLTIPLFARSGCRNWSRKHTTNKN